VEKLSENIIDYGKLIFLLLYLSGSFLCVYFSNFYSSFQIENQDRALGLITFLPLAFTVGLYFLTYGLSMADTLKDKVLNVRRETLNAGFEFAIFFLIYGLFAPFFAFIFGIFSYLIFKSPAVFFLHDFVAVTVAVIVHRLAFDKNKSPLYTNRFFNLGFVAVIGLLIFFSLPNGHELINSIF